MPVAKAMPKLFKLGLIASGGPQQVRSKVSAQPGQGRGIAARFLRITMRRVSVTRYSRIQEHHAAFEKGFCFRVSFRPLKNRHHESEKHYNSIYT